MNSTLPNFPALPAAPAAKTLARAGFEPAATTTEAVPADFAALMAVAPPSGQTAGAGETTTTATASTSSVFALCLSDSGEAAATEPTPGQVEQALAFAASLLQALLPEAVPPQGQAAPTPSATDAGDLLSENGAAKAFPVPTPSQDGQPVVPQPANAATPEFQAACAADGAIELKFDLTDGSVEAGEPLPANSDGKEQPSAGAGVQVEVQAELELPGQAVLRLEARGSLPLEADNAPAAARANFAGKSEAAAMTGKTGSEAGERNFESFDGKQIKNEAEEAGIAVAKPAAVMSSTATQETATARNADQALPVRADFQVMTTAAVEKAAAPAPENASLAERAVATVTNLVEAQFSASMQKSGSVQLRVKVGGEDVDIRVELRGGEVHTDFRTNSADLRAAISREWQTVAAQSPEQMRRYVEPVFSPGQSSFSSDQQPQQQSSRQQAAAQQDFSQHQRSSRQPAEEAAPFARASLLRDSFFPEPAAPRAPALSPTSLRLSALA